MVFERRPALILPENAQRLGTPGSKPWRDAVAHEKVQTLRGGSNGLLDRGKSGGLGHFDPCHEVRNHVAGAEDGGGVQKLLGAAQPPQDGSSSGAKVGFVVVRTIQVYVIPGSIR